MAIFIDRAWRVRAERHIDLPLSAAAVWSRMRDVRRFLTLDPLHARVRLPDRAGDRPPVGTPMVIEHRLFGVGPDRVGRLLRWREGRGYAFSDLSRRGVRAGFPHVCLYEVEPLSPVRSRLTFAARGRWTATWLPRWLIRLWLWWVLYETQAFAGRELKSLAHRRAASGPPPQP